MSMVLQMRMLEELIEKVLRETYFHISKDHATTVRPRGTRSMCTKKNRVPRNRLYSKTSRYTTSWDTNLAGTRFQKGFKIIRDKGFWNKNLAGTRF